MKRARKPARKQKKLDADDLRPSYDFSGGVRGKYVGRYRAAVNVVVLEPDIARAFRSSRSVNRALRAVMKARANKRH